MGNPASRFVYAVYFRRPQYLACPGVAISRAALASDLSTSPRSTLPKRVADFGDHERRGNQGVCLSKCHCRTGVGLRQDPLHRDARINEDHRYMSTLSRRSRISAVELPDTSRSSRASGRQQPKPPPVMAAIFPTTDHALFAPATYPGRRQFGAAARRSQDQDREPTGRACAS